MSYYIDKLTERLLVFYSFLKKDESISGMSVHDFMDAAFRSTLVRSILGRERITVSTGEITDGCRVVRINDRKIYWPEAADPNGLVFPFREIYYDSAGHMFDTYGTEIDKGDIVLDCGACEGLFGIKALEMGASKVYCLEPGRSLCGCLEKTFAREIDDGRAVIINSLLGDRRGKFHFKEDVKSLASSSIIDGPVAGSYEIGMVTLDEFVIENNIEKLDFIKMDVENAEVQIIKGAALTIKRFSPKMAIAVYHHPDNARLIQKFIASVDPGYSFRLKGIVCPGGRVRPMVLHACKRVGAATGV